MQGTSLSLPACLRSRISPQMEKAQPAGVRGTGNLADTSAAGLEPLAGAAESSCA